MAKGPETESIPTSQVAKTLYCIKQLLVSTETLGLRDNMKTQTLFYCLNVDASMLISLLFAIQSGVTINLVPMQAERLVSHCDDLCSYSDQKLEPF